MLPTPPCQYFECQLLRCLSLQGMEPSEAVFRPELGTWLDIARQPGNLEKAKAALQRKYDQLVAAGAIRAAGAPTQPSPTPVAAARLPTGQPAVAVVEPASGPGTAAMQQSAAAAGAAAAPESAFAPSAGEAVAAPSSLPAQSAPVAAAAALLATSQSALLATSQSAPGQQSSAQTAMHQQRSTVQHAGSKRSVWEMLGGGRRPSAGESFRLKSACRT